MTYAQLSKQPEPQNGGDGQEPSSGTVGDAPAESGDGQEMSEADWKVAAEQATAVAKGCGKLPSGVSEAIKRASTIPADWREILREFIEHTVPSDYSWMSPNRRHISNGIYLPGMIRENLGHIAVHVAIDHSHFRWLGFLGDRVHFLTECSQ